MGGKSGQTIGYWYILTMLSGLWRGPINALRAIEADEKLFWVGNATDATIQKINKPNLFGGKEKEGGIQGAFRLLQGERTQVLPGAAASGSIGTYGPLASGITIPDIKASIGGRVSELRGFVSVLYRGTVSAMNPYPKEWHYCGYRTSAGWFGDDPWYPAKATICMPGDGHPMESGDAPTSGFGALLARVFGSGVDQEVDNVIHAMNPAHIIYQALTDPEWGRGLSPDLLDENSFILAANTLCDERFGLCINWSRQEDVDTFMQSVIDHIVAALYTDRTTGKLVLKLIRDDYDPETIPQYDFNSGLIAIEEDDSASSDEMINEIIVKGKDQSLAGLGKDLEVRVHNNSARQAQGAISDTLELPGIPTRAMAARRGQMELKIHAPGLKRFKLKFDRRAWQLTPASVIRISAPNSEISNIVLRLGDDIDYGDTASGVITASAVEDVFGLPSVSFQAPGGTSTWQPPDQAATPAAATRLIEAGYRDILRKIGESDTGSLAPTSSFIGELAKSPGLPSQYDLLSRVSGESTFTDRGTGSFTERLLLSTSVTALATSWVVTDLGEIDDTFIGQAFLCEDEVLRLDALDDTTNTLTFARGCADTIPAPHDSGAAIWPLDDDLVPDGREYVSGEIVETKVLTRTQSSLLAEADAVTDSVTVVARHYKPYPPGDVQIDGTSIFDLAEAHPEPVLTFADRDRLTEDDQLIEHEASSVGPETGTTYTLRIKSADGSVLLRTETVTSGFTYDSTMQTADGSPTEVRMELESLRDSTPSWQMYSFNVTLSEGAPAVPMVVFLSSFEGASVVDESPLAQTVTVTGATQSTTQAKFGSKSLKFTTRNNDIATVPDHPSFFSGGAQFTIEGYFQWTAPKWVGVHNLVTKTQYDTGDNPANWGWEFGFTWDGAAGSLSLVVNDTVYGYLTVVFGDFTPVDGTWYHLATDWDGTTFRIYVDGVVIASATMDDATGDVGTTLDLVNPPQPLQLGVVLDAAAPVGDFRGYMDVVRVTSNVALYSPANDVFLSGFETTVEESPLGQTIALDGSTALSTTVAAYGTKSLHRPGATGGVARIPYNAAFFSGLDPWTVEGTFYFDNLNPGDFCYLAAQLDIAGYGGAGTGMSWGFYYVHDSPGYLELVLEEAGNGTAESTAATSNWTASTDTQYHIAATFDGTTYRIFVNGVMVGSEVAAYNLYPATSDISLGDYLNGGTYVGTQFDGYMDEVRITAGVARYIADFTPPSAPFPRV